MAILRNIGALAAVVAVMSAGVGTASAARCTLTQADISALDLYELDVAEYRPELLVVEKPGVTFTQMKRGAEVMDAIAWTARNIGPEADSRSVKQTLRLAAQGWTQMGHGVRARLRGDLRLSDAQGKAGSAKVGRARAQIVRLTRPCVR